MRHDERMVYIFTPACVLGVVKGLKAIENRVILLTVLISNAYC